MGEETSRQQQQQQQQRREWNREMALTTNLSLDIDKYPRDLLRGFMSEHGGGRVIHGGGETDFEEEESAIELNLGLSLGGRFGVDKTPRKLKRSSSVIGTLPFNNSTTETVAETTEVEPENCTVGLARTTSLPAEMEEEWRKRKEMQSLRRMEAKRRRCEKQSFKGGNSDDQTSSFETDRWVTASKSGFLQRHLDSSNGQVCNDSERGGGGSGGAKGRGGGGSSSSLSELDNKNQQGSSNSCSDERSPKITTGCSSNSGSQGTEKLSGTRANKANESENEKGVRREDSVDRKGKGMMATTTGLFDMPCVFTKGDGPNGRRVDGILYKYGKGEEVRIMCICHGSFLTPAEFVKHGGGRDVDRPLRHIVVNTSSSTF